MKLADWLEKLDERLDRIEIVQEKQNIVLAEHIRRTEALESRIQILAAELVPIKTHVAVVGAIAKVLAVVGTGVGIIAGIIVGIMQIYA